MAPAIDVRPARPGDGAAMGRVHADAWKVGYAHIFSAAFLNAIDRAERAENWERRIASGAVDGAEVEGGPRSITAVGELDGELLAICSYGPYRPVAAVDGEGTPPELCELWGLNVHPDAWGTGLAQAMMGWSLAGLAADHPEPTAVLWVLTDNGRGRRFYEKQGWAESGVATTREVRGEPVGAHRYAIDLSPYRAAQPPEAALSPSAPATALSSGSSSQPSGRATT
ncbi:MAG: GNAT family N-acetyltransferase [Actinomycetota bacterium]